MDTEVLRVDSGHREVLRVDSGHRGAEGRQWTQRC